MSEEEQDKTIKVEIVKKPWYKRWWAITLFVLIGLSAINSMISQGEEEKTTSTTQETKTASSDNEAEEAEPVEDQNKELAAGETFNGAVWSYTLHGSRQEETFGKDEYSKAEDKPEEKYVIVDFEIKNTTKKSQNFSSMISDLKIRADGGLTFDEDFEAGIALNQPIDESQIGPGLSNRGEVVFSVRNDAQNLKFEIGEEAGAIWTLN